ncbi:cytochrome b/b6 domain-containing protein [Rhodobacter sp. Har01]|uniref:cytochrome b/b6 domain-containing protein n=1 Tax=Rhodobacter sp. Har01 TaxID=2883999 RepID=UPI001D08314C|nr:cytochrome b/b6 domain-containing protein [Rhodobacter sp. Har01]MCB6178887.1 cytochrome b/b6 domain-containing protein [Rhodobacter sp. Har01]
MTKRNEQIWDPALRIFHWALAAAVVASWLLGQFGPLDMTLHFWSGYAVAVLIGFRLVWGFVGPRTARFASFLRGPGVVLAYVRSLPARKASHARGHNPLGGWSILAMLGLLIAQIGTGLILDPEDYINVGPLAESVSTEWNRWALGMHHKLGVALLALVVLHLAAILFYRFWKREDLVTPMITGQRR